MHFGERIVEERKRLKMTQADMAKACGVSRGMWGRYEKDKGSMGSDVFARFISCGADANYIFTGTRSEAPDALKKNLDRLRAASDQAASLGKTEEEQVEIQEALFCHRDTIAVPLVRAQLSAGTGSLETAGDVIGQYAFQTDWLTRKGQPSKMVLMRITGDSMDPEIRDGDVVLIDQGKRRIVDGDIFAIGLEDTVYVKRAFLMSDQLVLSSINPNYAPMTVDLRGDLANGVRIIGRVIWWCREAS